MSSFPSDTTQLEDICSRSSNSVKRIAVNIDVSNGNQYLLSIDEISSTLAKTIKSLQCTLKEMV